jgi:hypothetical protein
MITLQRRTNLDYWIDQGEEIFKIWFGKMVIICIFSAKNCKLHFIKASNIIMSYLPLKCMVVKSKSNQIKKFYLKSVHFITVQHKLPRAFQTADGIHSLIKYVHIVNAELIESTLEQTIMCLFLFFFYGSRNIKNGACI